jgi:hypothetical protein
MSDTSRRNMVLSASVPVKPHSSNEISPQIPRVIRRQAPLIVGGIAFTHLIYLILFYIYRDFSSLFGLPTPSEEFCNGQDNTKCGRPDLFAFQVVSGLSFLPMSFIGIYSWHISGRAHKAIPDTPEGRIYGYLPEVEYMVVSNLVYQIWDFLVSLTIPEHCTPIMMTHHVVAAIVCYTALDGFMLGRYSIFFMGLSEVSSIFLVLLDFTKYFHPMPGSSLEFLVDQVAGPLFVFCFILYRVILWWPTSYSLLKDVRSVVASGRAEQLRPGRTWMLYLILSINFPLGLLQLYWLTTILEEARKVVFGEQIA